MTTLTDFLLARIAEDEEAATMGEGWKTDAQTPDVPVQFWDYGETHIGYRRFLAECEAKRGILTFILEHGATVDGEFGCCHDADALLAGGRVAEFQGDEFDPLPDDCPGVKAALPGLLLLALPYADHPDYREEWKP